MWSCYMRSPCGAGREAILTGWAAAGAPVKLPLGVSYSVGAGTGIETLVLQARTSILILLLSHGHVAGRNCAQ